jgi:hypothetical protein
MANSPKDCDAPRIRGDPVTTDLSLGENPSRKKKLAR